MKKFSKPVVVALVALLCAFAFAACAGDSTNDPIIPPAVAVVTFKADGATYDTVEVNAVAVMPVTPSKSGYTFSGWFLDDVTFLQPFTSLSGVTASVIVYAKWTKNAEVPDEPVQLVITGLTYNDTAKAVSWDKVVGAAGYTLRVGASDKAASLITENNNKMQYILSETASGAYTVYVKALGNGTAYSDSAEATVSCVYTITNVDEKPGESRPETAAQWDKIMRDSYDALTKADANYKATILQTTVDREGTETYATRRTNYVVRNATKGEYSMAMLDFGISSGTYYCELTNENVLTEWSSNSGNSFSKTETVFTPEDLENASILTGGFIVAGKVTMGAMQIGTLDLRSFASMFDCFVLEDGVYWAKEESLEEVYNVLQVKMAEATGMSGIPEGGFERFGLRIENGFVAGIEIRYVPEEADSTTDTTYSFVFGGQSVTLPE